MGQWKTMVREVISYELFYLVLQNQQCAWFSGKGIDLFLRMQQWWVSVKIRAAVFWGNKTDVSSALALLERFVMAGGFLFGWFFWCLFFNPSLFFSGIVASFDRLFLSQSFSWARRVTWSNKQLPPRGEIPLTLLKPSLFFLYIKSPACQTSLAH